MKIILANPRGFCAGVNMAIESLEKALALFGAPLYVYHEIVHNRPIVERFRAEGVVFVDDISEVPNGGTVLYSAHGVSPAIREQALARNLRAIDATCPLVTKVHMEAVKFAREGYTIVLIGHEGHDEVLGTMGEAPASIVLVEDVNDVAALTLPAETKLAFLTQTTLSVDEARVVIDALRMKYPQIVGPNKDDICYATQNRQEAVRDLVPEADVVLVLGSRNSSNSQRLAEIARGTGRTAHLIDRVAELQDEWFQSTDTVLITAGASAPEEHVQACVDHLRKAFGAKVESRIVREEHVHFPLPRDLRRAGKCVILEEDMSTVQLKFGPADHNHPLTLDDFESAEYERGFKYEIIDGRLYVSPLPNPPENILESWLYQALLWYQKAHPDILNYVSNKPRVFVEARRKETVPEPDIACYSGLDLSGMLRELSWGDMHPVLLVEVLVDGEPAKDLVRNPKLYLAVPSIKEYWVLDGRENPDEPTLIQHRRHGKRWIVREYPFGSLFSTKLLPGFSLLIDPRK